MRKVDPKKGIFPISVVADILDVHPRTLRIYEEKGIIKPSRSENNRRLYSQHDVERLEYIHYLTQIKKVNLAGVCIILDLLSRCPQDLQEKIFKEVQKEIDSFTEEKKRIFKGDSKNMLE
ncbi:MAG: MerR family transcriptional regulator, heat shock protein HspR [Clostridia bacterium]|nr:MerR family transcriptional regulator, heat shock protein HspR [Clostridia bacterium]